MQSASSVDAWLWSALHLPGPTLQISRTGNPDRAVPCQAFAFPPLGFALTLTAPPAVAQETDPAPGPVLPSVALPPELDRVLRDYERAWRARDAAGLAALFTPDGFVLSQGRPPVQGHDRITEAYRNAGGILNLRALGWATADSVGYVVGAYGWGDDPADTGKFVLALRRGPAGRWLIAADIDNSNRARAP